MHLNTDFRWLGNMPIEVQLPVLDEFVGNLDELTLLALIQLSPRLAVVFCFDGNYLLSRIMRPASRPFLPSRLRRVLRTSVSIISSPPVSDLAVERGDQESENSVD